MKLALIGVSVIGLAAVAGAIIVGSMSFEGVVAEHPYEQGLGWDKANALREASGIEVHILNTSLPLGRNVLEIKVGARALGGFVYEGPLEVMLTRPETSGLDRTYTAQAVSPGSYEVEVDLLKAGNWDLVIEAVHMGNTITFKKRVYALGR